MSSLGTNPTARKQDGALLEQTTSSFWRSEQAKLKVRSVMHF